MSTTDVLASTWLPGGAGPHWASVAQRGYPTSAAMTLMGRRMIAAGQEAAVLAYIVGRRASVTDADEEVVTRVFVGAVNDALGRGSWFVPFDRPDMRAEEVRIASLIEQMVNTPEWQTGEVSISRPPLV